MFGNDLPGDGQGLGDAAMLVRDCLVIFDPADTLQEVRSVDGCSHSPTPTLTGQREELSLRRMLGTLYINEFIIYGCLSLIYSLTHSPTCGNIDKLQMPRSIRFYFRKTTLLAQQRGIPTLGFPLSKPTIRKTVCPTPCLCFLTMPLSAPGPLKSLLTNNTIVMRHPLSFHGKHPF